MDAGDVLPGEFTPQPVDLAFGTEPNRPAAWTDLARTALMAVMALALVFIAWAELRQAEVAEREDCRFRAMAYRPDGVQDPGTNAEIERACGGTDPFAD